MIRRVSTARTVKKQERRVAEDVGGRRQVGSGNQWHAKGDVSSRRFLIETKQTGSKSYGLTLQVLDKINLEAAKAGKEPVLQVDFMKPAGIDSFVVIPYYLFLQFLQEA